MKRAIRVFEYKFNRVFRAHAIAKRFRDAAAEDIYPMGHITLAYVVVTNQHNCFILLRSTRVFQMELEELVIQNPASRGNVVARLPVHLSC